MGKQLERDGRRKSSRENRHVEVVHILVRGREEKLVKKKESLGWGRIEEIWQKKVKKACCGDLPIDPNIRRVRLSKGVTT